jgi:hypothetical protein
MTTSTWVTSALLVGAVFAFMLFRERWRLRAVEAIAAKRQFRFICPFVPEDQKLPAKAISDLFSPRGALRWGAALQGELNGVPAWIMECEASRANMTSAWYTLVAWPVTGPEVSLVLGPTAWHLFSVFDLPEPPASPDPPDPQGWEVAGSADARATWLTPERSASMSRIPPPCVIGIRSGYAGFRVEGVITPSRIEQVEQMLSGIRETLNL